ncbi:uncharacterized protein GGS22DRAFT_199077 [Annulohypoxylon maeteangense]|uniref:uncharacterized protein n=1 Tax=Annulohypoxylon maeteangense TaxID=1927788 RepID=UPI0020088E9E|nr:uncharacterized protein GGS22DRAFT_199077 [Annulohypoxylon maeteangense]KAI0886682.1 hypothetical protein GGS22DRAFT_199077 [Annulohypoxylon maeteangense]
MGSTGLAGDRDVEEVAHLLSEVHKHGIQVVPVVKELVVHCHNTLVDAKIMCDHLFQENVHLEARYAQLQIDFNVYCADRNVRESKWKNKAKDTVFDDLHKLVNKTIESNKTCHEKMAVLVKEHLEMSNDNALLRAQVEELRSENQALMAAKAKVAQRELPASEARMRQFS